MSASLARWVVIIMPALTGMLPRSAFAQARVVSEPAEPSLLALTRGWSRASSLGDLREARTSSDHLELRVWAGYDTSTTQAVVVRRAGGRWAAFVARVLRCEMQIPLGVGDTASARTMQSFVAEARRHCSGPVTSAGAGVRIITADTVVVAQLALPDSTIERAWTAAVNGGALEMPGRAKHAASGDGLTYVVELRRGSEYRASEIERVDPPETEADRQMRRVYAVLATLVRGANGSL
jgi:hypothetical protein